MPDLPLLAWLTLYAVAVVVILFFLFGRRADDWPVAPTALHVEDSSWFERGSEVRINGRHLWVHLVGEGWIVVASWPPDE